jgi:ABC-type sugar transport system ATPase subunit
VAQLRAASVAVEDGQAPLVALRGIVKSFAGVAVLEGVGFIVRPGEVVMLVGENGAGKSTLKNILCGVIAPDVGVIDFLGRSYTALSTALADRLGIGTIHQELSLFGNLSVAENIHLPHLPRRAGLVDRKAMRVAAATLLGDLLGSAIDPVADVDALSLGERQLVEIAKSIHRSSSLLILDEPTTCLSLPERQRLFEVVRRLRTRGFGIIYITHFMEEVYELADRIVVLRDGVVVGDGTPEEIPLARLARLMVGHDLGEPVTTLPPGMADAPVMLEANRLSDGSLVQDVSFSLRAGEILGLAGLVGAGRSETAELLLGLRRGTGEVTLVGRPFTDRSPRSARARGLVLVSEDRRRDQAFLARPVRENLTAPSLTELRAGRLRLLAPRRERQLAEGIATAFGVDHPGLEAPMVTLSGGNQQKAILGRWFEGDPAVCILDEPTKGVDIGAREAVHRMILERAAAGVAFLLITSDLAELRALAHRVLVLHKGRVVADLGRADADLHHVMALASTGRAAA